MGRSTQGVTLISVDSGTVLSGLQRIAEGDEDDGDDDDDIATDDSIDKVSD
jgi:DNA gyrase subunit A